MNLKKLTKLNINGKVACIGSELKDYLKLKHKLNENYLNSKGLTFKHDYDFIDSFLLNNRVSVNKQSLLKDRKTIILYTSGIERIIINKRQSEAIALANQLNIPLSYIKEREYMNFLKEALRDYECIQQYPIKRLDGGYYFIDMVIFNKNSNKTKPLLCIECDEFNHSSRDTVEENFRQAFIEGVLQCPFYRFNPDSKDFSLGLLIADVYDKVNSISKSKVQKKYTIFAEEAVEDLILDEVDKHMINSYIKEYFTIITYELESKGYKLYLNIENTENPCKTYIKYQDKRLIDVSDIIGISIIKDNKEFIKTIFKVKYKCKEKREILLLYEISKNKIEIKANNFGKESDIIISKYIEKLNYMNDKERNK